MKPKLLAIMGLAVFVAVVIATNSISADGEKPLAEELRDLKRQRLETAKKVHQMCRAAFDAETVTLDQLLATMRQLVDAERAVAAGPHAELDVLKESVNRLKQLFAMLCPPGYPPQRVMGERNEYEPLQLEIQTSEIAVLEFRLRNRL